MAKPYIVITPARNEQENIGHTIRSMAAQTQRPLRWVIVNDGSTDETGRIIDEAAREHSWITPVHRKDRGFRQQGGGVIEAFYVGYALLGEVDPLLLDRGEGSRVRNQSSAVAHEVNPLLLDRGEGSSVRSQSPAVAPEAGPLLLDRGEGSRVRSRTPVVAPEAGPLLLDRGEGLRVRSRTPAVAHEIAPLPLDRGEGSRVRSRSWDFVVKFDADLSFSPDYFERCLNKFSEDPKLGIGGGMISHEVEGRLACESPGDPAFHVRGATKIYRRACWEAIHPLLAAPGWDTLDELKANMLGWTTVTFRDIPLRHHRSTGSVDGTWKNHVKFGLANYITGYHPLFMLAKCFKRCVHKPYVVGALALFWGFWRGYLKGEKQVADPELIRYVRRQQFNKLMLKPSLW